MNKLIIIGNLTRDPETSDHEGIMCTNFTVAVNRRVKAGAHPQADYVRVTVWRGLAENCANYLAKGRKVCCVGPARSYGGIDQNGEARSRIEMNADEVEFLGGRDKTREEASGADEFTEVDDDELPFN